MCLRGCACEASLVIIAGLGRSATELPENTRVRCALCFVACYGNRQPSADLSIAIRFASDPRALAALALGASSSALVSRTGLKLVCAGALGGTALCEQNGDRAVGVAGRPALGAA